MAAVWPAGPELQKDSSQYPLSRAKRPEYRRLACRREIFVPDDWGRTVSSRPGACLGVQGHVLTTLECMVFAPLTALEMEEAAGSPEAAVCLCCKDAAAASGTEREARSGETVALRKAAANSLAVARREAMG